MRLRAGRGGIWCAALCFLALAVAAAPAQAFRSLVTTNAVKSEQVPGGQIEGACGLAVGAIGLIYVSDYYHHAVDVFGSSGDFSSQIAVSPLDGVCGLAVAPGSGSLYGNEWHEGVKRLLPSVQTFDSEHESTGVAVDAAKMVYVDDRTYVAVYEPSGAPVLHEGQPLKIGAGGSLGEGYGLAVFGGRVYVADAADQTVKVYEPAGDPATPVATITHGFTSLANGALAVDPSNGHLLVLDNLQPGYESPEAAILEFDSSGTFLDRITAGIVDGEPSGLAVSGAGNLYVTSGNSEDSTVIEFGPYSAAFAPTGATQPSAPSPEARSALAASSAPASSERPAVHQQRASASEVVQHGPVRVAVRARITPRKLPRSGAAPVRFALSAEIASTDGGVPPQLRQIAIEINRNGHLDPAALPACSVERIQPSTTAGALEACRRSLVGEGTFSAKVLVPQQTPFPSVGKIVAFNGRWNGRPAILAHVFGTDPVPTSYTLPFVVGSAGRGTYGAKLTASLPRFTSKWGYVTGISLNLGNGFSPGAGRGYLSAGCPAPEGFPGATFPLTHTSLSFGGIKPIAQTLTSSCGVR